MIESLISEFSNAKLVRFLRSQNSSFVNYEENLSDIVSNFEKFDNLIKLGEIEYENTDKLIVFTCQFKGELTSRSSKKTQYEIAKKALKEDFKDGAVFVFYDQTGRFRFSFIRKNYGDKNQKFTPWKRYTYFVEPDAKTNRTFIERIGASKFDSLDVILQAFSVEKLTKDFYKELSDWYFWAINNVSFPNDCNDDSDDKKYNSENIIRLITRLIFVWFLKQKGLIRNELFEPNVLSEILYNFDAESLTQNNYYRAILQNLFFATLNQEIGQRGFAPDNGFEKNRSTYAIKNLYRYEKEFQNSTTEVMQLFSQVPFLNGGLFECLDRKEKEGKVYDWDGFSRNPKYQANIPNALFFAKESKVDLSGEYNDKKMKAVKVAGIIEILNRYNFTVEENTPVEVEVALDPELLGKVFENLLGAFNPETQETARKQTGSFYTPREIVNYMVDESLIAYFQTKVPDLPEDTLRLIFSYEDEIAEVDDAQRESLIQAAFDCKILDPACGSGAFPMGILQQMVHVLKKLDPDNTHWNNVVMTQAMKDFEKADKLSDEDIEEIRTGIEKTFDDGLNHPDYARKLHVIENCIYGVDIQSIAVQISKLRFFISLVCEQGKNTNAAENFGIRPLPNLETKFVAANTLIGLEKTEEDLELFSDTTIKTLIDKLQHVRHRQFLVTNATEKKRLRDKDQKYREDIENEVSKLYVKHKDENKNFYVRQKALAEKELELIDKTIERSAVSTNIFGEQITKTYKPNDKRKKELGDTIKIATKKIEEASDYSRLGAVVALARQLTSWNPYDQNDSSPFFDPEWMFGLPKQENGYFDVVIGNPPYIDSKKLKNISLTLKQNFETYTGSSDIYVYFYEIGFRVLNPNGILTLITSNKWIRSEYGRNLRKLLLSKINPLQLLDFGTNRVFDATVDCNIIIAEKSLNKNELKICNVTEKLSDYDISSFFINNCISNTKLSENAWLINLGINENLKYKIETLGVPLCELGVAINRGILTGLNEAFIIDGNQKAEFLCAGVPNSIFEPIIKGKNIDKYIYSHDDIWLINSHNGQRDKNIKPVNVEQEYNIVYKWLESFLPAINNRTDKGIHWSNLRNCAYLAEFKREKIIYQGIAKRIVFSYDSTGVFCDVTTFFMTGDNLKYFLAILNSKFFEYILLNIYLEGDTFKSKNQILQQFPFPKASINQQSMLIKLIEKILKIKKVSLDSTDLEQEIDNFVYRLYDLTYVEVKVIDPEIESKISEADYNAIEI